MQLVPVPADPQQLVPVPADPQQQMDQLANQNRQLAVHVGTLTEIAIRGIEAIQGLQRDNLALQGRVGELHGRVGELEREKETLEQRVAETENHNQQLSQNLVNVQTENAQLAQRVRNIELEEDAKKVDQLRDTYINGGLNRLGGSIMTSVLVSPIFWGSTLETAITLGLSAVNPSILPWLAFGTVGTGTFMHTCFRGSQKRDLEYYESECLDRNPNATKREVFEYGVRKVQEAEEAEELRRQEEERQIGWECPNACSPDLDY